MDIQTLETFLRVADMENFTKAAEALSYAQSTVTMQIKRLEQELGFPLFERIGRKNYLTEAGKCFLPQAKEIIRILQQVRTLNTDAAQIIGTIRVGVLESLLFSTVLDILPRFSEQYPGVDILLKIGQASELLDLLKQNQLDFIYVSGNVMQEESLYCCYKRQEEMIFTAAPTHPLAQRTSVPIDEILHCPFIVAEPSGRCYGRLQEIAAERDIPIRHAVIVDNIRAIALLLKDGQSLSFLPGYSLESHIKKGELVRLNADIPPQIYYSQILFHADKWLSPYMEYFIELIRQAKPENGG